MKTPGELAADGARRVGAGSFGGIFGSPESELPQQRTPQASASSECGLGAQAGRISMRRGADLWHEAGL